MEKESMFQERFIGLLKERGIALQELSAQTEISQQELRSYCETGEPTATDLIKLVSALGVTSDYLLGLSDKE